MSQLAGPSHYCQINNADFQGPSYWLPGLEGRTALQDPFNNVAPQQASLLAEEGADQSDGSKALKQRLLNVNLNS